MKRKEPNLKRFSVVAIVALCAVLSSMLVMRRATGRMANELLQITVPPASQGLTQAGNDLDNVPDPRVTLPTDSFSEQEDAQSEESTEALTSEDSETATETPPSAEQITTAAAAQTTAPATTQASAIPANTTFILPLENATVEKPFSPQAPVFNATMRDWRTHSGIDFAAEAGSEIRSVGNGKVSKVIADPRWGYTIEVDYGTFTARYCALSQQDAVGIDAEVRTGDVLGYLAEIPLESADAPHLHFETVQNGVFVDPLQAMGLDS